MRALVQRVTRAACTVDGEQVASIGPGLVVLLGVARGDGEAEAEWMARKLPSLRIFPDADGRMGRSVVDVDGSVLLVSQFTLYGELRKGTRPSFSLAMEPGRADDLYRTVAELVENAGVPVKRGIFGASMQVELVNDGPVTLMLERSAN